MPLSVQAYKCNWCNMTSVHKASVVRHEKRSCPKHKACKICKFYEEEEETVYNPYHGGDPGSTDWEEVIMWCKTYDKRLEHKVSNCPKFKAKEKVSNARK